MSGGRKARVISSALRLVTGALAAFCLVGCTSFLLIQPKPARVQMEDLPPLRSDTPSLPPPIVQTLPRDEKGNSKTLTALPHG